MIYKIKAVQAMLSRDVAKLYQVETRVINQVIKRNIRRFPNTFCFQLTEDEIYNLRSQIVISSENNYGGTRYLPYVLTEQGIIMLSGLLKSNIAVKANVQIKEQDLLSYEKEKIKYKYLRSCFFFFMVKIFISIVIYS